MISYKYVCTKLFVSLLLLIAPLFCETTALAPLNWVQGSGGTISTLAELRWFSETWSANSGNWELGADIDASETSTWNIRNGDTLGFTPINNFMGLFNGKGYTISHLYINRPNEDWVGLFRMVSNNTSVEPGYSILRNIYLDSVHIIGGTGTSGLAGEIRQTFVENCHVKGSISGGNGVGGLFASAVTTSIHYSSFSGTLNSEFTAGGIVSSALGVTIHASFSSGTIIGGYGLGGLVGMFSNEAMYGSSTISNSLSLSHIHTKAGGSGGLVGTSSRTILLNSYFAGDIIHDSTDIRSSSGPIKSSLDSHSATVINSYYDSTINTLPDTVTLNTKNSIDSTQALSTEQFAQLSHFKNWDESLWEVALLPELSPTLRPYPQWLLYPVIVSITTDLQTPYIKHTQKLRTNSPINTTRFYALNDTIRISNKSIPGLTWVGWSINGDTVSTSPEYTFSQTSPGIIEVKALYKPDYSFAGGNGTEEDPYQIATLDHLMQLSTLPELLSKHFLMISNIDASSTHSYNANTGYPKGFTPIGFDNNFNSSHAHFFTGSFDGGGHTISHLYINNPEKSTMGLFASTFNATIKNIVLDSVQVAGNHNCGGLIGYASSTEIRSVFVSGSVSGLNSNIGGVVGLTYNSNITNTHFIGNVTGVSNIGGVSGISSETDILKSSARTHIIATLGIVGGLVGQMADGSITESFSDGTIEGQSTIGGFAGSFSGTLSNSFSAEMIQGPSLFQYRDYISAFIGYSDGKTLENNYIIAQLSESADDEYRETPDFSTITSFYYDSSRINATQIEEDPISEKDIRPLAPIEFSDPLSFETFNFDSIWTIKLFPEIDSLPRPYHQWYDSLRKETEFFNTIIKSLPGIPASRYVLHPTGENTPSSSSSNETVPIVATEGTTRSSTLLLSNSRILPPVNSKYYELYTLTGSLITRVAIDNLNRSIVVTPTSNAQTGVYLIRFLMEK